MPTNLVPALSEQCHKPARQRTAQARYRAHRDLDGHHQPGPRQRRLQRSHRAGLADGQVAQAVRYQAGVRHPRTGNRHQDARPALTARSADAQGGDDEDRRVNALASPTRFSVPSSLAGDSTHLGPRREIASLQEHLRHKVPVHACIRTLKVAHFILAAEKQRNFVSHTLGRTKRT